MKAPHWLTHGLTKLPTSRRRELEVWLSNTDSDSVKKSLVKALEKAVRKDEGE